MRRTVGKVGLQTVSLDGNRSSGGPGPADLAGLLAADRTPCDLWELMNEMSNFETDCQRSISQRGMQWNTMQNSGKRKREITS